LLQRSAKHVDAFIAPSRFSKRLHDAALGVQSVYLPNFVPLSEATVAPENNDRADRKPYFLFVGRLEMLKGPQTLIPLFSNFSKAQLWIAGTGNYESQLRQLAGTSENIRFLGHQTERELKGLYRNALAVIVPSLFYEVFPLVTIEAFRQRTPIIVKNIGGLPEIVEDSGGGFVYDSEEQLKSAIDRLASEPTLRAELGSRGYQHYKHNWTPEAHFERYFDLIEELSARRRERSVNASVSPGSAHTMRGL
jgi:glycosyltransferase involved in cell wall biosynthesis